MAALLSLSTQLNQSGAQRPPESQVGFVVTAVTVDIFFAQMIVAVLGVMAVTGEYSTGVIKASLAAVPKWLPMLPAKAIVVFVATYLVGLGGNLASYLLTSPILALRDVDASLLGLQRGQGRRAEPAHRDRLGRGQRRGRRVAAGPTRRAGRPRLNTARSLTPSECRGRGS